MLYLYSYEMILAIIIVRMFFETTYSSTQFPVSPQHRTQYLPKSKEMKQCRIRPEAFINVLAKFWTASSKESFLERRLGTKLYPHLF